MICIAAVIVLFFWCTFVCLESCSKLLVCCKSNDESENPMDEQHNEMSNLARKPTEPMHEDIDSADNHVSNAHSIDCEEVSEV